MSKFNLRKQPRISYYEPQEPNLDEYIFCEQCADYVYEYCSIHGPLLVVPDDKVPAKPNVPSFVPRAALTIPKVFLHIAPSVIPGAGLGVFTTLTLPRGVRFGPYKGEKTTEINSMYCWQIYDSNNKPSHVIDAADANKSNWMRYVNCARHWREQNLLAFQYQGQLYYRTIKIIPRFTELMVFYGSEFANSLRVDLRKYNAPPQYARKYGAPLKKPKTDPGKENNSKSSNEEIVKTINTEENIPEHSKKTEHFEQTTPKSSCTETAVGDQNNNVIKTINTEENIPEHSKKTEHFEQNTPKSSCTKTEVGDQNYNIIKTSKEKYICNECGCQFHKKTSIILHLKMKHVKDVYFRCNQCAYYTVTKEKLDKHLKVHDENRLYACRLCNFRFKSKNNLKSHKEACGIKNNVSSNVPHSCTECGKKFHCKFTLKVHMRIHSGEKPYTCSVCKKQFNQSSNLKTHEKTHTGEKPYTCTVCNRQFSHIGSLKTHMRIHTGEKPYTCMVCKKKFNQSGDLKKHIRTHTGDKPYTCTVCKKQFNESTHLKTHMRTHTGERPYTCTVCKKQFNESTHLKTHMRTHTGERPYTCTVCKKQFNVSGNLKRHMRTHTGEKPYTCTVCKNQFNVSGNLKRHMRTHTGEKPYTCTVCKNQFNVSGHLKRHMRTHTGD